MSKRKKTYAVRYKPEEGVVEVTVRDGMGNKECKFVAHQKDKGRIKKISTILKMKYDIDFTPNSEEEYWGGKKDFFNL